MVNADNRSAAEDGAMDGCREKSKRPDECEVDSVSTVRRADYHGLAVQREGHEHGEKAMNMAFLIRADDVRGDGK